MGVIPGPRIPHAYVNSTFTLTLSTYSLPVLSPPLRGLYYYYCYCCSSTNISPRPSLQLLFVFSSYHYDSIPSSFTMHSPYYLGFNYANLTSPRDA